MILKALAPRDPCLPFASETKPSPASRFRSDSVFATPRSRPKEVQLRSPLETASERSSFPREKTNTFDRPKVGLSKGDSSFDTSLGFGAPFLRKVLLTQFAASVYFCRQTKRSQSTNTRPDGIFPPFWQYPVGMDDQFQGL